MVIGCDLGVLFCFVAILLLVVPWFKIRDTRQED